MGLQFTRVREHRCTCFEEEQGGVRRKSANWQMVFALQAEEQGVLLQSGSQILCNSKLPRHLHLQITAELTLLHMPWEAAPRGTESQGDRTPAQDRPAEQ